jgi:hypothetical protein
MAQWVLIPCLDRLRFEFNLIAPDRAKGADGSVGDLAHQEHTSDHNPDETGAVPIHDADKTNEVHAIDITTDLRTPGLTLEQVVQFILSRCRAGTEDRLRYMIFNRRIWKADNDWRQEAYTGTADPHTGHAHFSGSYVTAREADTSTWHLEDIPVALTTSDKTWLAAEIDKAATNAAARVWATQLQRPGEAAGKTTSAGAYQSYNDKVNKDTANAAGDHVITVLGPMLEELVAAIVPPAEPV